MLSIVVTFGHGGCLMQKLVCYTDLRACIRKEYSCVCIYLLVVQQGYAGPVQQSGRNKGDSKSSKICNYLAKNGKCKYGDKCRFSHVAEASQEPEAK